METVNNLINSASKMVYGENTTTENTTTGSTTQHSGSLLGDDAATTTTRNNTTGGTEPLSGQTGAGTANQPYDAGNTTGEPTNTTSSSTTGNTSSAGETIGNTTGSSAPLGSSAEDRSSGAAVPASKDPNTSATGTLSDDSISKGASANAPTDVGSAPPDSGHVGQKQQGADRPGEEPGAVETEAIKDKQAAADEVQSGSAGRHSVGGASGGRSGPDPSDSGPKPLGGDSSSGSGGDKENLGSVSKEPGTGEKYIKSSGTKADGGDFDAANAGAGREADRLLEEKGIHREDPNKSTDDDATPSGKPPGHNSVTGSEEKTSVGQKLKEKLHIGSSSK